MKWAALTGIVLGALAGPPTPETLSVLSVVEALAAGIAVIGGFITWRKFRALGDAQREEVASSAAQKAVSALDQALARYVAELELATASIGELKEQLQGAKERIAKLEEALHHSNGERARLQERLDEALTERGKIELRLAEAEKQVASLQRRVGGRRQADARKRPDPG